MGLDIVPKWKDMRTKFGYTPKMEYYTNQIRLWMS